MSTSRNLVVNADDFGRSSAINQGIIEAHQNGIVTSASLMVTREAFAEAVDLAKENPRLAIGLHLDLDDFFEVQHGVGRLVAYKDPQVPFTEIADATEAQIQGAMKTGLRITHVDGHHHVHLRPELFATIAALVSKYKINFIRHFKGFYQGLYPGVSMAWVEDLIRRFGLRSTDVFFAGWQPVKSSLPGYSYFDPAVPFKTAELMVHPGKGEAWREQELVHCISPQTRSLLKERDIQLVNFGQL